MDWRQPASLFCVIGIRCRASISEDVRANYERGVRTAASAECTVASVRDYRPQSEKTRFDRVLQAFARTRFGGWLFIHVLPVLDRPLLRVSRGRLSTGMGQTYVLLHARGVKSGIERTVPLLGTKSGAAILLVASKAGDVRHPAWFHNVRAHPDVAVTVNGERRTMRARVAAGEVRALLHKTYGRRRAS
jgi:deazaflavin-dependent oxidoreductase (nitroreductase family)